MKRLYAPWRHDYVNRMTGTSEKKNRTSKECVFCKQFAADEDDTFFILKRFTYCAIMMNFYPYNSGHVMILPYDHKGELDELSSRARAEMMDAVSVSVCVIGKALGSEGFNIGINIGSAGGGGIPSHLHIHVLPRWRGDTNFLEVIGETKLISGDFEKTFKKLKKAFANVSL